MPQIIEVPGQGLLEFPDGMSDGEMMGLIEENFPNVFKGAPAPEPTGPEYGPQGSWEQEPVIDEEPPAGQIPRRIGSELAQAGAVALQGVHRIAKTVSGYTPLGAVVNRFPQVKKAEESGMQFARDVQERAAEDYGVDPSQDQAISSQFIKGLASMAPVMASGGMLAPVTGAAIAGESARQDAEAHGATEGQKDTAFWGNAAVGALTEKLMGVSAMLSAAKKLRIGEATLKELATKAAGFAVEQGFREGTQEGSQQVAENVLAKWIAGYDPERGVFQNVPSAIGMGALLGKAIGGVTGVAGMIDDARARDAGTVDIDGTPHAVQDDVLKPVAPGSTADKAIRSLLGEKATDPIQTEAELEATQVEPTETTDNTGEPSTSEETAEVVPEPEAGAEAQEVTDTEQELSRTQAPEPEVDDNTFERAQSGDESAFDEMDQAFREREGIDAAEELSHQRVHTEEGFERLFNDAFEAKDFDAIHEAIKLSHKDVWKPLLRKFFAEQATNPEAAAKADWMRHVFNGTRPVDAKASTRGATKSAPPPPRTQSTPPRQSTAGAPPPRQSTPPPKTPPPPPRIPVSEIKGIAKSPYKIISDFSKAIGKKLRIRRMKASQLGLYRPGSTLTADRFAGDLDTASHELAGHWTDDKYGIGKPWLSKSASPYDAELEKFWIHGSPSGDLKIKRAEGIAEFVRAYVMNPDAAKKQAPKFWEYFEKTLPKPAMKTLNDFSNDVRTWAGEDPIRRAGLNSRTEGPTLRERLRESLSGSGTGLKKTFVDRMREWFDDSYHYAVKGFRMAAQLQGKNPSELSPDEDFELSLRLMTGFNSRLEDQLENGLVPLQPKVNASDKGKPEPERLIDPVTKSAINLQWLLGSFDNSTKESQANDMRAATGVMIAQRTLEKAAKIDQEAQEEIAKLDPKSKSTPLKASKIKAEAAQKKARISGIGAGILPDVEAAQQTMDALSSDPKRAVRILEAARRYRLWADTNIQYLVDSGRLSKTDAARIRSENSQYVDMHRLSEEFDVEGRIRKGGKVGSLKDIMKRFKGSTLEIDNVYKSLLDQTESIQKEAIRNGVMQQFTDMLKSARRLYQGEAVDLDQIGSLATEKDRNTIQVWNDGKAQYWKFDKDIHEALKGLGDLGSHAVIDLLAIPTSIARYTITHAPSFVARNPLRDIPHRAVVSNVGSKPWDILSGYSQEELSSYNIFGGGQFGNYIRDRNTWNRELKRAMREARRDRRNVFLLPMDAWRAWGRTAEASEKVGRISEFRAAFKHAKDKLGYSDENAMLYAAGQARGLMDYAKAGSVMRVINRLVPFSNAHVRGLTRSIKAGMDRPAATAIRWALYVLLPRLFEQIWNRKDEETWKEYIQQPAYLRDFFLSFKVGPYWLRIPTPHELGVLGGSAARMISSILGDDPYSFEGHGKSVATAAVPIGGLAEATGPLKTPLEITMNRDTFRDRSIVPDWEKDLKLELRKGTKFASDPGKIIGDLFGTDPRYVDHFLRSYGGFGQMITSIAPERNLETETLKATGLVVSPPSVSSRDYQWVMDWARKNGKLNSAQIKRLKPLRDDVFSAKGATEVDVASKILREEATEIRERIESKLLR